MSRWVLSFLILMLGCGPEALDRDWQRIEQPFEAPDFTLNQLSGPPVSLSGLRGQVVIMEFWATWCAPCRMSTPSLEAIYREHKDKPVTVLLVNAGEAPDTIRSWAGDRFLAPILLDTEGTVRSQYRISGIPHLLVMDKQGRIVYDKTGYSGGLEQSLRLVIQQLLAE